MLGIGRHTSDETDTLEESAPWAEPQIVPEVFLDGLTLVRTRNGGMRAVGWQNIIMPDGSVQERRVIVRFVVPPWVLVKTYTKFRNLWPNLWQFLADRQTH